MLPRLTRRRCLKSLVAAGIVGAGYEYSLAHQKTFRVGVIGAGIKASNILDSCWYTQFCPLQAKVVMICDVNRVRAEQRRARYAPSAQTTQDYRKVLERDDIDAVFVITPDHWHVPISLAALESGKHVYCEKPMTLTIAEGWQLRDAVHRSGRTFLVGTQQRSDWHYQLACELVRNGRLGQLNRITITVPERPGGGPFSSQPVPEELDWDRWLGPAPSAEYCEQRYLFFRNWYEYSGGVVTDWGAHHVDIAHWAMGLEDSGPIHVSGEAVLPAVPNGFSTPGQFRVDLKYANDVTVRMQTSANENYLLFEGDRGRIRVTRGRLTGKPVEDLQFNPFRAGATRINHCRSYLGGPPFVHLQHFLHCIGFGDKPISDVDSQHRSISACHLAGIALRLQRPVLWDPKREAFVNDGAASTFLSRVSRPIEPVIAKRDTPGRA